ncbi:hypothetical protein D9615_010504 [Tricholomella constricta]|uniref:Uncharacterized protein n=1 Tax=Tricholomella constricta TaxID=117010 RepID=A0A8H5LSH5_9AGAR|nr:hypothetical protein D9615_010504 [Tricholomella constricta]
MAPPLAGKPPYATDEPDSFYESAPAPQRRVRQQPAPNPNDRSSAYDVYNNYLSADDRAAANRQSGVGALGLGLLNMDDDSDSDDDSYSRHKPQQPTSSPGASPSKHAALAAATANQSRHRKSPSPPPKVIAAPQPGYAAPIAALNTLARPEAVAAPQGRAPPAMHMNASRNDIHNPFADPHPPIKPHQPPYHISTSPTPSILSNEPHPLQPPVTPITPVFARPAKPGIKFSDVAVARDQAKPIMRSDKEETLLPSRGEKGDDFWRRFSMVAKEENKKPATQKTSPWLRKTQSGSTRLSRWVWIVGLILLVIIGGAIGIGWYVSHKSPDHQQPTAIGGSANEAATAVPTSSIKIDASGSTIKHVTPTHTVKRHILDARATPVARMSPLHKRRHHSSH